jgi:hypothetical protein
MNELKTILTIFVGLALVAYTVQQFERMRGVKLALNLGAVVACSVLGYLAFDDLDYHPSWGIIAGTAAVAFGPDLGRALRDGAKKVAGQFFDKFSKEKEPGFSGDTDEDAP